MWSVSWAETKSRSMIMNCTRRCLHLVFMATHKSRNFTRDFFRGFVACFGISQWLWQCMQCGENCSISSLLTLFNCTLCWGRVAKYQFWPIKPPCSARHSSPWYKTLPKFTAVSVDKIFTSRGQNRSTSKEKRKVYFVIILHVYLIMN